MLGINRRTLERWERGDRVPSLKYVRMMVDKFYITDIYEFMFGRRYNYERRLTQVKKVLPIILLMVSCNSTPTLETKKTEHRLDDTPLRIARIENCEYFVGGGLFTHKGNCSNPIHTKLLK